MPCSRKYSAIAEAVNLLSDAKRIMFLGLGTSAAVAKDAEHKFFRFNTPVTTQTDPLMLRMLAAGGVPGDVFFLSPLPDGKNQL